MIFIYNVKVFKRMSEVQHLITMNAPLWRQRFLSIGLRNLTRIVKRRPHSHKFRLFASLDPLEVKSALTYKLHSGARRHDIIWRIWDFQTWECFSEYK